MMIAITTTGAAPSTWPTGGRDIRGQGVPQLAGIAGRQVDLIALTVEPELNGLVGLVAVQIVNQRNRDLLCHFGSPPVTFL